MKKGTCFLFLISCFLFFSVYVYAGPPDSTLIKEAMQGPSQVLKSNPFPLLMGTIPETAEYRLVYEIPVAPRQSLMLGASYLGLGPVFKIIEELDTSYEYNNQKLYFNVSGFRLQAMYRIYLSKHLAPRGFYWGPQASYSRATLSTPLIPYFYYRITYTNYNILFGYQWIFRNKLALDVFAGLGYKNNIGEGYNGNQPGAIDNLNVNGGNLKLSLGSNIGFAF